MRISTRLRLAAFIPVLMALVVIVTLAFSFRSLLQTQDNGDKVRQIRSGITELNHIAFSYILYHEDRPREQFVAEQKALTQLISSVHLQVADQQRLLDTIDSDNSTINDYFLDLVSIQQNSDQSQGTEDRIVGLILAGSYDADTDAALLRGQLDDDIRNAEVRTAGLILLVLVLAALSSTILLLRTRATITTSLSDLKRGTSVIGSGDLDYFIPEKGQDEISDLTRAFNDMTVNLKTVTASKTELQKEITERNRIESALRESEERFLKAFQASPAAQTIASLPDGRCVEVNDQFLKLLEFSREEVIGHTSAELKMIQSDQRDQTTLDFGEKGKVQNLELTVQTKNGKLLTVLSSNEEIILNGRVHSISTIIDITERKKAENALRESEERFRSVLADSRDVIYRVNLRTGRYEYVSPSVREMAGYSPEEFMRLDVKTGMEMVHPDDIEAVRAGLQTLEDNGQAEVEYRQISKAGGERWISNRMTLVNDNLGRPLYRSGNIRDITGRKKAELDLKRRNEELAAANKELESFSYTVSHDLRAPLRSLDGYSKALLEDHGSDLNKEARKWLDNIRGASQLMGKLIDDILGLSRVIRTELKTEKVDLSSLASSVVDKLKEGDSERNAEFAITPGAEVSGDYNLLNLVLQNLLGNAFKFTSQRPDARIEFGVTQKDGVNVYFVKDNGAGFDMRFVDELFKPFQRLHSSKEYPGTGIGLVTVQRIVQRHGGKIWAEGEVNRGSTFYFTLGQERN